MVKSLPSLSIGLKYSGIFAKSLILHPWNKQASQRYILDGLAQMSGLNAKLAQFLAMKFQDHERSHALKIPAMPIDLVKSLIAEGSPVLHAELLELSETAKVASLGQVHEGRLRNGLHVAIKVQFPQLEQGMREQLAILRNLGQFGPPKKFRFAMDSLLDYFSQSLLNELNYCHEAQQQQRARSLLQADDPWVIPQVYPEYSSQTILVQSYEGASDLATVQKWWPDHARKECAEILLEYFLKAIFHYQLMHSDPHPGNLGFRNAYPAHAGRSYELVLYDFGSVLAIEQRYAAVLWQLLKAYRDDRVIVPFDYLVALDFDAEKILSLSDRLPCLMAKLLEPFLTEAPFAWQDWRVKEYFERVLGDERWWFRSAGPPWFLMLMRSAQGILHALEQLKVRVQSRPLLQKLQVSLAEQEIPSQLARLKANRPGSTQTLAKHLLVRVESLAGEVLVNLALPASAVDELEDIIPEDSLQRLQAQKIDLPAIKLRAQRSGYQAQELFQAQSSERRYRVWLE